MIIIMKNTINNIVKYLVFVSCLTYAQTIRPLWLDNPKSVYPEELYLTAIGEGDNRDEAEKNAVANLSLVFESSIKVENELVQNYKELISDNTSEYNKQSEFSNNISISSTQTLYNIQYAENYTDHLGHVYVLAFIDRSETAEIYIKKIRSNDERVTYYMNKAQENADLLLHYAYLKAAAVIGQLNRSMATQLEIISSSVADKIQFSYNLNNLLLITSEAAKNVSFQINIQNDSNEGIKNLISELINAEGFVINSSPILSINGSINFEKISLNRSGQFIRWTLSLTLENTHGDTILSLSKNGREGSITYEEAEARSLRSIQRIMKDIFIRDIDDYFTKLAGA